MTMRWLMNKLLIALTLMTAQNSFALGKEPQSNPPCPYRAAVGLHDRTAPPAKKVRQATVRGGQDNSTRKQKL